MTLPDSFRRMWERENLGPSPGEPVVVGVSGGADSLALLHLLIAYGVRTHAAILDHGLRGAAGAADADFARQTAAAWGASVTVGRADVAEFAARHSLGLEDAARRVRYAFLLRVARRVGASRIAVGHHQDDQAETVLMRLIRGSGLTGLRGMLPAVSLRAFDLPDDAPLACDPPLGADLPATWPLLVRPLLETSRAEIETYCAEHGIQPRHDATNDELTYLRNRIRHEALPLLEQINPNARAALARAAALLRDDHALVERAGQVAFDRVARATRDEGVILDRVAWDDLSRAEQRLVIRLAIRRVRPDLRDVGLDHIQAALDILATPGDSNLSAALPGGLLLRQDYGVLTLGDAEREPLELLPGQDAPALEPGQESPCFGPDAEFSLVAGGWQFTLSPFDQHDLDAIAAVHADPLAAALAVNPGVSLLLRSPRRGDRIAPHGIAGTQKLSKFFQRKRVPRPWRARVPVLVVDGQIAWVVAPSAQGVRGWVADPFWLRADSRLVVVARWQTR